ncbi:hypothetical protein FRC00_004179, partial [Tulasnella sp. 408]
HDKDLREIKVPDFPGLRPDHERGYLDELEFSDQIQILPETLRPVAQAVGTTLRPTYHTPGYCSSPPQPPPCPVPAGALEIYDRNSGVSSDLGLVLPAPNWIHWRNQTPQRPLVILRLGSQQGGAVWSELYQPEENLAHHFTQGKHRLQQQRGPIHHGPEQARQFPGALGRELVGQSALSSPWQMVAPSRTKPDIPTIANGPAAQQEPGSSGLKGRELVKGSGGNGGPGDPVQVLQNQNHNQNQNPLWQILSQRIPGITPQQFAAMSSQQREQLRQILEHQQQQQQQQETALAQAQAQAQQQQQRQDQLGGFNSSQEQQAVVLARL